MDHSIQLQQQLPNFAEHLPNYGLANTSTGFATLFCGIIALMFCYTMRRQPPMWIFAYWMIVVTGVFTITLHGYGETNPVFWPRWFWGFLDTGSNIMATWAIALAIVSDFYRDKLLRNQIILTLLMLVGVGWHFIDRHPSFPRSYLVELGSWGGFYPGEACLIVFALLVVVLFYRRRDQIPVSAMPLLYCTTITFFIGLLLATAPNDRIVYPFLSLHALWHLVSAFGFVMLWAFNHVRFSEADKVPDEGELELGERTLNDSDD